MLPDPSKDANNPSLIDDATIAASGNREDQRQKERETTVNRVRTSATEAIAAPQDHTSPITHGGDPHRSVVTAYRPAVAHAVHGAHSTAPSNMSSAHVQQWKSLAR